MKKLAKIAIIAAATSILVSAFADPLPAGERLDWGIYSGIQLGYNDLNSGSDNQTRNINGTDFTFKASEKALGGNFHAGSLWPVTDTPFSFGAQIGATYWGQYVYKGTGSTTSKATYDQISFNIEGVAQYTLDRTFYLRVGLGPAFNLTEESGELTSGSNTVDAKSKSKVGAIGSATLGWFVSQPVSVYVNVQHLFSNNSSSGKNGLEQGLLKSTQFAIGVAYDLGP